MEQSESDKKSEFDKRFEAFAKVWAVPALVITIFKTLLIDVPTIGLKIYTSAALTRLLILMFATVSSVAVSMWFGGPGGLLHEGRPGSGWRRKHYITAFLIFGLCWIAQLRWPEIRGAFVWAGISAFVASGIALLAYGIVLRWRKLPA